MRILNINARSIINKTTELEGILLTHDPHVTILTETWLHSDICDEDLVPNSYKVYRRDRPSLGGGVAIILKTEIPVLILEQIEDHESLCIEINSFGNKLIIFAVYRSPSSSPDFLPKLYDNAIKYSKNRVIIAGDFNLPNINWSKLSSPCQTDHTVFEMMLACNLAQAVNTPTRVQSNTSSILDLVFHSMSLYDACASVEDGLSDHKLVLFTCRLNGQYSPMNEKQKVVKDFSRANDESVLDYLDLAFDGFCGNDVNYLWNTFKSICHFCLQNFVPNKTKKVNSANPWINREIIHLVRKIKRIKKRGATTNLPRLKQMLSEKIRASKKNVLF